MHINLIANKHTVGFGPVKALLSKIEFKPLAPYENMALKVLFPLGDHEDPNKGNLTDSAEFKDQIRFFMKERIARNFINIQQRIMKEIPYLKINIYKAEELDEGSKLFFDTFCRLRTVEIHYVLGEPKHEDYVSYFNSRDENSIETLVNKNQISESDFSFLINSIKIYINSGDSWTAERLLDKVEKHKQTPFINNMKGLVFTLLGRTVEGEYYYQLWRNSGDDIDLVRANYAISMLYLRHHPKPLRSLELANKYLDEAYSTLQKISSNEVPQVEFETVFNRNGYALYLFRIGKVEEAMNLIEKGIQKLSNSSKGSFLHKTVLMYNLAQCHKQLGNHPAAIKYYKELLLLDPYFPEYHAELARCYINCGDINKAITSLETARSLNPAIKEVNSLLGFCFNENDDKFKSKEYYKEAWELEPKRTVLAYDYAYVLNELECYQESIYVLNQANNFENTSVNFVEDYYSLLSESYLNIGEKDTAIAALDKGLSHLESSQQLEENKVFVNSIIDSELIRN